MRRIRICLGVLFLWGLMAAPAQEVPEDFPALHSVKTGDTGEGFIFLSVSTDAEGVGYYVLMVDDLGEPFLYRKLDRDDYYSYDFKMQPNGLTSYAQLLSHHSYAGGGDCIHLVMDEEMNVVDSFQMGNGYVAEAHDFQLLPNGHSLAIGYYLTEMDLSDRVEGGYPNALVSGGIIQELDTEKNVVWQWRSWDQYDRETFDFGDQAARKILSFFHLNAVSLDSDRNLLIGTPLWTKKIDRGSGEILWHLGGEENQFSFAGVDSLTGVTEVAGHAFYRLENGNYLVYDNGHRSGSKTSQAHEYRLDQENLVAEKIRTFTPDSVINAWHRGNAQRLPNGNTLVGWGGGRGDHIPVCTEFDPDGNTVLKLWFDDPSVGSYRAVRFPYPPKPEYRADIIEVGLGNTYELKQGDTLDIGITVEITDLFTVGYSELNFTTCDYGPRFPTFAGRAPAVLPQRVVMDAFSVNEVEGTIRFRADRFGIENPGRITVYQRSLDGEGDFLPLPTAYNPVTGMLSAEFTDIGEFIFGFPDIPHSLHAPLAATPERGSRVNLLRPVRMEWSPRGFYDSFRLQLSADEGFTRLLLDSTGLRSTVLTWNHTEVNDTVYWRVKTHNDAGEGPWSDTGMFVTRAPFVQLTSPRGNEVWRSGLDYFIEWEDNIGEDVVLELFLQGQKVMTIDTVESRAAFRWEIPFQLDSACGYHIRISSVADPAIHDVSAIGFSMNDSSCANAPVPDVAVISPNGGEQFDPGETVDIMWENSSGEPAEVTLVREGIPLQTLATGLDENRFAWTIPMEMESSADYRISVTVPSAPTLTDASNSGFRIGPDGPSPVLSRDPQGRGFRLFPNPSEGMVTLEYALPRKAPVEFRVYTLSGLRKKTLRQPVLPPGTHRNTLDLSDLPSGTYVVQQVGGRSILLNLE